MILTAIYDLACAPPTYDFISFLVAAERRRRDIGAAGVTIAIVPGPAQGFRRDALPPFTAPARAAMLEGIVLASCALLPSCRGAAIVPRAAARFAAPVFPDGWRADRPVAHYGLRVQVENARAGVFPLRAVSSIAYGRRMITLTLRESSYWPGRNSDRAAWLAAASRLAGDGWTVVIVPDTESPPLPAGPWIVEPAAAVDLAQRAALYQGAVANLFANNGPAWLATFMSAAPVGILRMEDPTGQSRAATDAWFARAGLPRGAQLGRPGHRIFWGGETAAEITAAAGLVAASCHTAAGDRRARAEQELP